MSYRTQEKSVSSEALRPPQKIIGQYPFFGIENQYLKGAREATEAEWKLLARYQKTKQYVGSSGLKEGGLLGPGKLNGQIKLNSDYQSGRNQDLGDINLTINVNQKKTSITKKIFDEGRAVKQYQEEDSATDQDHLIQLDRLKYDDFELIKSKKPDQVTNQGLADDVVLPDDNMGPVVVPFFPSHWQEKANEIFNQDFLVVDKVTGKQLMGSPTKTEDFSSLSNKLVKITRTQAAKKEYQERPTSGKHFSRSVAKDVSAISDNFQNGKKVESLMKKLAEYMAEEDMAGLAKNIDLDKLDQIQQEIAATSTEKPTTDVDEYSQYQTDAHSIQTEKTKPSTKFRGYKDIEKEARNKQKKLDDLTFQTFEKVTPRLPIIHERQPYEAQRSRSTQVMPMLRVTKPKGKSEKSIHIYRDFITSLTPVQLPVNRQPFIYERTTNPDVEPAPYGPVHQRLQQAHQERIQEVQSSNKKIPKKNLDYAKKSQIKKKKIVKEIPNQHRAFWINEPNTDLKTTMVEKPVEKPKMELLQQFELVRGKLQPALKYMAPQPIYNRYKIQSNEVITYPAVNGEVKLIKEHISVLPEMSNRRGWGDGEPYVKIHKTPMDIYKEAEQEQKKIVKDKKIVNYNTETKRGNQGDDTDPEQSEEVEIHDPRNIGDLEEENIDLKEQMIHAMLTLEQYLSVAYLKYREEPQKFQSFSIKPSALQSDDGRWANYETEDSQTKRSRKQSATTYKSKFQLPSQVHFIAQRVKNFFTPNKPYSETKSVAVQSNTKQTADYQKQLMLDIDRMSKFIIQFQGEYQVTQIENQIRDNKRIIVNFLTDNIFNLRFGFVENSVKRKTNSYQDQLYKILNRQKRRLFGMEQLFKTVQDRAAELNTWLIHSETVCFTMKVRLCEDIIVLLQQKNLLAEFYGRRFIKVGVIENEMGIMLKLPRIDPGNQKDFHLRKLQNEISDGADLLELITKDSDNHIKISDDMRDFVSRQFNNPSWQRLLQARWLRKQQINQDNEFDPEFNKIEPIAIQDAVVFKPKRESPRSPKKDEIVTFEIKPIEIVPQPNVTVEDPLNILADEIDAENEAKRKQLLTETVQKENEAKKEVQAPQKFESKWVKLVKEDQFERVNREQREREERLARYKKFLEEDLEDDEEGDASLQLDTMKQYLNKVTQHLEVEKTIINAMKQANETPVQSVKS